MTAKLNSHKEILIALGGGGERPPYAVYVRVARGLGEKAPTVYAWARRNSIPPWKWDDIIALAYRTGVLINYGTLVQTMRRDLRKKQDEAREGGQQ